MNNDRIVLKSKSNFLSIPTGTIISVSYHGGMVLEITYKTEGSKSLFDFSQRGDKAATFWFNPYEKKLESSQYINLCAEIESANARKVGYSFEEI